VSVRPIFLIGFPAAGKTSVGRTIAARTGRGFVDLDDAIGEGDAVSSLVARDEPEFRRREAAALQAQITAADSEPLVVATGGGAAMFGDNLERMRAAGLVVALGVDVAEAERRAQNPGEAMRPLLTAQTAGKLAAKRAPTYRRAHAVVDTTGRAIDEVARDVLAVAAAWTPATRDGTFVALGDRTYAVVVAPDLPADALREAIGDASRVMIVTDGNVARHHLAGVLAALGGPRPIDTITVEPGEASKSFTVYQQLTEDLVRRGLDRGSAIVALGGGVVGDLAGFVAATLFRGIPIVQLPTTIVAMTDAAIGGKTAIDLPAGKNLVGAFHQPRLVACDLSTLATLPARERRAGFGELWKYALLDGPELWTAVDACAAWAAGPENVAPPEEFASVVSRSIAYKAAVVGRDERERTGHRALLNLGHTIGHAIESASGMLHGEAVALGLLAACRVSAALGHADREPEIRDALARTGLPVDLDRWLTDDVLARIAVDKKRVGAKVTFVTIADVGACVPHPLAIAEIQRFLRRVPTP
jgi:shikimate kinase/3-dehydroquinate synthase